MAKGFRTWCDNHFEAKKTELNGQLNELEHQRLAQKEEGREASRAQNQEIADLTAKANQANADKEQMKENFNNAFAAYRRRKEGNVYIPKVEHIFTEWA